MSETADLIDRVRRILTDELGPALGLDDSAMEVLDIQEGVARVRLGGVCSGCPNTLMMMIHGLESELRRRVPGITCLEVLP
jgi:Fe-S cluster biogenesis protein NfuA